MKVFNNMMLKRKLKVKNEYGLHSRPASTLVRLAQKYDSDVLLYRVGEENKMANCKSVLQILLLGANKGTELILSSYDSNAIEEISGFFERSFDEAH
jgi:phosphotransferase system HPr (HPr) family protein